VPILSVERAAVLGFGMGRLRQTYMIMPLEKKVDTLFSFLRAQADGR
jgi:hypothetical protein